MIDPGNNSSTDGGPRADPPRPRPPWLPFARRSRLILLGLVILVNLLLYLPLLRPTVQAAQIALPYSTFLAQISLHNVSTANLSASTASGAFVRPYLDPASRTRIHSPQI